MDTSESLAEADGGGTVIAGPNFDAPPVRVAMLMLWFRPIRDLRTLDLAELRVGWRDTFPRVSELPPLQPWEDDAEDVSFLGEEAQWPMPACLFSNFEGDREVLIQFDRFVLTWKFDPQGSQYPGFKSLFDQMKSYFDEFTSAIGRAGNEAPMISKVTLQYRNVFEGVDAQDAAEAVVLGRTIESTPEPRDLNALLLTKHYCPSAENRQVSIQVSIAEDSGDVSESDHNHSMHATSLRIMAESDLEPEENAYRRLSDVHDSAIDVFLNLAGASLRKSWGERNADDE